MLNDKTVETNAGYTIEKAEAFFVEKNGVQDRIVLGHMTNERGEDRYVTWDSCITPEGHADYFWGHYFDSVNYALEDYHKRLSREYDRIGRITVNEEEED